MCLVLRAGVIVSVICSFGFSANPVKLFGRCKLPYLPCIICSKDGGRSGGSGGGGSIEGLAQPGLFKFYSWFMHFCAGRTCFLFFSGLLFVLSV